MISKKLLFLNQIFIFNNFVIKNVTIKYNLICKIHMKL